MIQHHILLLFSVYVTSQEHEFFMLISASVNLDCFNLSGSVSDSNNTNNLSCLTSSVIVEKQAPIYLFKIRSKIDSSSFLK